MTADSSARRRPGYVTWVAIFAALVATSAPGARAEDQPPQTTAPAPFTRGLPDDPKFFPLAVWLQSPRNAGRYRDIGINTYVALWRGPTLEQLDALDRAGMVVIVGKGRSAAEFRERKTIVGWMHDDEPDNAQSLGRGKGYGPPVKPEKIVAD